MYRMPQLLLNSLRSVRRDRWAPPSVTPVFSSVHAHSLCIPDLFSLCTSLLSFLVSGWLFLSPGSPRILLSFHIPMTKGRSTSTLSFGPHPFSHKDQPRAQLHSGFTIGCLCKLEHFFFFFLSLRDRWLIKEQLPFRSCQA